MRGVDDIDQKDDKKRNKKVICSTSARVEPMTLGCKQARNPFLRQERHFEEDLTCQKLLISVRIEFNSIVFGGKKLRTDAAASVPTNSLFRRGFHCPPSLVLEEAQQHSE